MAALVTDRPGTVAKVRFVRMSASKVRVVLNLIRGKSATEALEILDFGERLAAREVAKCLRSAIANAGHNEDIPEEELFVAACFSDEGPTLKRFRPRARGRAGKIHKQTCHITIEVRRYTDEEILEQQKREELKSEGRAKRGAKNKSAKSTGGGDRSKRVAKSKQAAPEEAEDTVVDDTNVDDVAVEETPAEDVAVEEAAVEETATEEAQDSVAEEAAPEEAAAEEVVEEQETEDK